ncbi:MAG: hypothetical protein Q7K57_61345 [Burkholderiaceae bacterium]|nr:hypothetical protein [Burkholderiaceae bacterium]
MPTKFVSRVAYAGVTIYSGATALLHRTRLWDALKAAIGLTDVDRVVVTATGALTIAQCGTLLVDASGGNIVLTLPASGVDADEALYEVDRLDATANTVTFVPAGADTIGGAASVLVTGTMRLRLPAGKTDWRVHSISGGTPAKALAALGAAKVVGVRQTVLSGPVDSDGFSAFGGSTGGTTVTASGTLIVTAANGFVAAGQQNRIGSIVNPSWTGLSTNGTMYMYLDVNADETCTTGSGTLLPGDQWGGPYSTIANQFTFNKQEMIGKVGNGATADQTYRVYAGEVTVAGGVVTAITWYALMGRYDSGWTATLPSASAVVSKNSNLGVYPDASSVIIECISADNGYAVGDRIVSPLFTGVGSANSGGVMPVVATRNTVGFATGSVANYVTPKAGGVAATLTLASWKWKIVASRGIW